MELSCEIPHKYVWHNLHCHWPLVSIRPPRNKVKSHVFLQVASEIDGDYERSPLLYIYTNLGTIHTSIYRSVDGNGLAMVWQWAIEWVMSREVMRFEVSKDSHQKNGKCNIIHVNSNFYCYYHILHAHTKFYRYYATLTEREGDSWSLTCAMHLA